MHSHLKRILLCQNETKQNKNPTVCGNYLALMEQCKVNAFNLVPFQLVSLALHVLHDCINSSLCRWTEDSLLFPCSKGSKAVGVLAHGWKTRREESSFFSDKHSRPSNWALHKLRRNAKEKCRTAEVSVTLIHSGHRFPELLNQENSTRSQLLEPASHGLLKGEHVSESEPWSKPWQGKHTLTDSLQHPSFTNYNKGFTSSLQHKMHAENLEKTVPWKWAPFLEMVHGKWKAQICINMF